MEFKNVTIIGCKIGRDVEIDYLNHLDSRDYKVKDDELPHPDLRKSLDEISLDLADAFMVVNKETAERYVATGFKLSEKEGVYFANIQGKFTTVHNEVVKVTSGNIEIPDDVGDPWTIRIKTLRTELYKYFFEGKCAQQKLPFKESETK
jgi:hypothetical protein